jgi:cytochrome c biogenesis protein CcdA
MIDCINILIDNYNIPLLTAFLLGILTSISPCPLATNVAAIAYISREIKTAKNTLLNGLFYIIGRVLSYSVLATLIYFGLSSLQLENILQQGGEKIMGPILILIGLIMLNIIKINFKNSNSEIVNKVKNFIAGKGYLGSFILGIFFALAFCPYSAIMFFGVLMPLILESSYGLILAPVFAIATGIPVIVFSFVIAFSVQKIGQVLNIVKKIEQIMRYVVAFIFISIGIYYLQYFF